MEQTSWEAIIIQSVKNSPSFMEPPKIRCRVHNSPPLVRIMSQMNPVHTLQPHFPKIHVILTYDSSAGIMTRLRAGRSGVLGFDSRLGLGIFLPPPRPERLWGPPGLLFNGYAGVKRPGRAADHSPPSSAEVKNAFSYISIPPVRLHGVVLS
jgi:hypothetical protein